MNKLIIAAAAAMSLPAIAAISATSLLAQSSLGGPAQRAAADVNMDAVPFLTPDSIRKVQLALQKKGIIRAHRREVRAPDETSPTQLSGPLRNQIERGH